VHAGKRPLLVQLRLVWLSVSVLSGGVVGACRSALWDEGPLQPFVERMARNVNCSLKGKDCPVRVQYDESTDQSLFAEFRDLYGSITGQSAQAQRFYFGDLAPYQKGGGSAQVVAVCDKKRNDIFIDRSVWEQTESSTQELLVLHEMGHCLGDLGHNDTLLTFERRCMKKSESALICFVERPESVMHPLLFHPDLYKMFRAEYHEDLRNMHAAR
jgi:hypothetical protein